MIGKCPNVRKNLYFLPQLQAFGNNKQTTATTESLKFDTLATFLKKSVNAQGIWPFWNLYRMHMRRQHAGCSKLKMVKSELTDCKSRRSLKICHQSWNKKLLMFQKVGSQFEKFDVRVLQIPKKKTFKKLFHSWLKKVLPEINIRKNVIDELSNVLSMIR